METQPDNRQLLEENGIDVDFLKYWEEERKTRTKDKVTVLTTEEREKMIDQIVKITELMTRKNAIKYKQNFYQFNKDVIGWPDIYEPLHKKVCDFIQDNIEKRMCLLLLPRGTFKSSIVTTAFPLWQIAKNPNTRGLIANATYPMACQFLGQVKDNLQKNDKFIELYDDLATNAPIWREDALAVNTEASFRTKEPTVTALGVGSNYTGKHFDWAILDDLVNRDNIRTIDRINEVINFYKDVLDLVDPSPNDHKRVIVIGTTWHQADLYSWIKDPEIGVIDDFAVMRLPAYGNFIEKDGRDYFDGKWGESELLFPDRLNWNTMEKLKKSQGPSHFAAQYLLDPVPPDDAKFKNFKYYEPDDVKAINMNKFVAVDPALVEDKEADYSAMVCVGVDRNNDWYILDIWRDQVSPKKLIEQMFYWDSKHKPITFGLEATAFQRILQYYLEDEMKNRGQRFPVKELRHTERSKKERIDALEPRYASGSILHPKAPQNSTLWKMERYLRDELERHPKGKNDDLADALASILEVAFPPKTIRRRRSSGGTNRYPA